MMSWLDTHHELVKAEFHELRRYADGLERALENEQRLLEKETAEQTAKMSEEDRFEYFEWASEDFHRFGESFPKILRYSLFVHTYSILEQAVLRIADGVRDAQQLDLSPNELRDDGIMRAKTYIKKVGKMTFPDQGTDWQDILALNLVRNLIVHNSGFFPEDYQKKQQIERLMAEWPNDIGLDDIRRFTLSREFIERVLEICEQFTSSVFSNLKSVAR